MTTPRLALIAFSVVGLALCGCKSDQKAASDTQAAMVSNKTCPISGESVPANAKTVSYNGKTVGFCCGKCADKWSKMSDADKTAKLAAASK
jgi:hypothetical protein